MKNPATIYLADDDFDDRSMLRDALIARIPGVEIVEAFDGQDLIDKIKPASSPLSMIILTDWNMPRLDGLEVAKIMKSDPGFKNIPIVMVSTNKEQKMIQQAYAAGISKYIVKPVLWTEFLSVAENIRSGFEKLAGR
ncbi:Chemotaxis protein CheY [Dyadobacter sp. CECT 9623]|uniref:Chemotaxis protein CheY n=1 Tax=Dyadobacter linearis TaxID=2823330 RepID=A0ABM8UY63_9BACT|nr:response regulator [Dyadobacter sp. CECT 9623]CAG5074613.1 Chemotaxis protein CheY [Dyadobacter sp. CECT 9623]